MNAWSAQIWGKNITFIIKSGFIFRDLTIDVLDKHSLIHVLLKELSAVFTVQVSQSLLATAICTSFGRSSYRHRIAHTQPSKQRD